MAYSPPRDMSICRYCKLKEPAVTLVYHKGKSQGECKSCKSARLSNHARKLNYAKALYQSLPQYVQINLKTLGTLQDGSYRLLRFLNQSQVGYITVENGQIFVTHWNERHLFLYRLFDVASWLGNLGLFLDSKPYSPPESLAEASAGLQPVEVGDRLLWFDKALEARCIAVLEERIAKAKAGNMAKARAAKALQAVQKTPSEST